MRDAVKQLLCPLQRHIRETAQGNRIKNGNQGSSYVEQATRAMLVQEEVYKERGYRLTSCTPIFLQCKCLPEIVTIQNAFFLTSHFLLSIVFETAKYFGSLSLTLLSDTEGGSTLVSAY